MTGLLLPLLAAATATGGDGLAVFDRLVGQCWEGEVAPGALNVHCFEAVYGGAHVSDRHKVLVDGRVVYEGETLYSREGDRLAFTYWNSLGGIGRGHGGANGVVDGEGICFTGEMRGRPDDTPREVATCWRWLAGGGYQTTEGDGQPVRFTLSARRL